MRNILLTGFYYHYRLYDPQIGLFYQIDQFFIPYVYAGAIPCRFRRSIRSNDLFSHRLFSMTDVYLGSSAAKKDFRFCKFDWTTGKTWFARNNESCSLLTEPPKVLLVVC